jgi:nucleotide-binding universal stress UspA family protein
MVAEISASKSGKKSTNPIPMQILLAYDGSKHAQAAVDMLGDLPLSPGSKIKALAVLPTQHLAGHEALQERMGVIKDTLEVKGLEVESVLRAGNPAATINELARCHDVDLTIVGAKGLRATLGILLGGVAQQVVEYSCCPVLVVREPYQGLRRVLLVTDGSIYSHGAVEYLAPPAGSLRPKFPLPDEAEVTVMHVLPPPITPDMMSRSWTVGPEVLFPVPPAELDIDAIEQREAQDGQALLKRSIDELAACKIPAKSILVRGDAATEIIEHIREYHIDLVVAGSRGLSQVTGWLLGSVSRKLVHYAGCSVLVVKRPPE